MNIHKLFKAGCKYIVDSNYRLLINASFGRYDSMPDEEYLRKKFKVCMGKPLNLDQPQTFNEKLQWLKLYDRKPEYTIMVDKYLVRDYIAERLGEEYLIPLLGVWDDPDEIDFDALPNQFVLKCNHNSGLGMCICRDKSKLNIPKVKRELRKGLEQNYYLAGREWPYKNVPPKIIAEQLMRDESAENPDAGLADYKFFCFDGFVKFFKVDFDRFIDHHANYFDCVGELLPFGEEICPPKPERKLKLPTTLKKMIMLAEKLASGQPFLRVDFYDVNGRIYFGELTFFPASGFGRFIPEEWDEKIGDMLTLPKYQRAGS